MQVTLLDELFGDTPVRRTPVPQQGVKRPKVPEQGLARAIGKLSKRLTQLEQAPLTIEPDEAAPEPKKAPTPVTVPIVPIVPIPEDKKEENATNT
jgi:hypothetical protein